MRGCVTVGHLEAVAMVQQEREEVEGCEWAEYREKYIYFPQCFILWS
jgi:hypothetical protein